MIVQTIQGDIRDTHIKNIAHGVNCQNKMGSGVAKVLFDKWPIVKESYHEHIEKQKSLNFTDISLLGTVQVCSHGDGVWIWNCFTQRYYGYDGKKYISYDAIYECFKAMVKSGIKEIAIPKIGCGLAGGNWEIVKALINDATGDELDVYVYYLE